MAIRNIGTLNFDDIAAQVFYMAVLEMYPYTEIDWGTTAAMGPLAGRWHGWRWKRERRRQYRTHAALELST